MNRNLDKIGISGIRKFYNKVIKVEGAMSLTLGEPDFNVPKAVKDGMIEAINNNKTTYTGNAGIEELRVGISDYLKQMNIDFDASEICVTVGGSEGLYAVFTALLNAGDKVLIPSPAYPAYVNIVNLLGAEPVTCPLKEDFSIDLEVIKEYIEKHNPKVLVLSFPCNPTGAILSKEDRDGLYEILKDKDITVVTDEIYGSIYYEDEYYSVAQYKELKDKIILIGGFSKMFCMTGMRIGYVCATDKYMSQIIKVHQYNVSCAPSVAQYGAAKGLKESMDELKEIVATFKKRRDFVYNRLVEIGLEVVKPKGAFYIFASIEKFNMPSEEFCEKLLLEQKVAIVPGNAFGAAGDNYIRISYCYSDEQLKEALNRLEKFVLGA